MPSSPENRSTIITVVLFAIGILAVYGALSSYQLSAAYAKQYPDAFGSVIAQVRFAPLLERVPATAVLGYFSDIDRASDAFNAAFLAAQHAVGPRLLVLVDAKDGPEWAVGNFSKPQDYGALGATHGYQMVADMGNGIVLFKRSAR